MLTLTNAIVNGDGGGGKSIEGQGCVSVMEHCAKEVDYLDSQWGI